MYNVVWFRSDLRVQDNPALFNAINSQEQLPVRALFYVNLKQWQQHDWGYNKISFVLQCVLELQNELAALNIPLEIRYCDTFAETVTDLNDYLRQQQAIALYFNHEYELNEQLRDTQIVSKLSKTNIKTYGFHSQCLIQPGVILNKQQKPYTVFTPFKKACYEYLYSHPIGTYPKITAQKAEKPQLATIDSAHLQNPILKLWPADATSVAKRLQQFCDTRIRNYKEERDYPEIAGTSSLSPYLAVGRISVQQCFVAATEENNHEFVEGNADIACWISELIWRDFYKHIMFHFPELCKGRNFNRKYDKLKWDKPGKNLQLWQQGQTGIPIIDAAMRQLVTTGWMHNRLRMIVAMFLTKNLLIDWRHGEKFFSEHLVDLDLASNNGGWQWSASTGTDAVPYFRIFNPVTQSERFDLQGTFIKQYCPELKDVPEKFIHDPSAHLTSLDLQMLGYPARMVDLGESRKRAIEYFKAV